MRMATSYHVLVVLLVAMFAWSPHRTSAAGAAPPVTPFPGGTPFNRSIFPPGFIFGAGSSAYQYEGAWNESGKGPSIWDTFTHQYPDKIADKSNGDVALDFYHRYKEDVLLAKKLGVEAFRFSIAWTRILPKGSLSGGINIEGVRHYNNLIDHVISNGMIPFVTLFHWDVPQALEDRYLGFLSPRIIDDYLDYVDVCFKEFGDRVKNWVTFNEPMIFSLTGYAAGIFAPGRCTSGAAGVNCTAGNSSTEPYIVTHHQLLAHAAAVKLYREKYQKSQKGKIAITLATTWYVPLTDSKSDAYAFKRATDFLFGWYMDPLTRGEYPLTMRKLVGNRLPTFTKEQSKLLIGSFDFITLNYYTATYVYSVPFSKNISRNYLTDSFTATTEYRNGVAIGPLVKGTDFYIYPRGIRDFILYTKENYNSPIIYITENGVDEVNNASLPLDEALNDPIRIEYYRSHLTMVHEAIRRGADVRAYMVWSLFDDFEWNNGYTIRFGLYYIDYKDDLKRYPKRSAFWFRQFLNKP